MENILTRRQGKINLCLFLILILLGLGTRLADGGLFSEERVYIWLGERNPLIFGLARFLALIGSAKVLVPFLILGLVYSFKTNKRDLFIGLLISIGLSFLGSEVLKAIFKRPRPLAFMLVDQGGYSYPSGHCMVNSSLYLFLAYYMTNYVNRSRAGLYYSLAIFGSILMAISRVYLGVHYITDIIGGLIGGYLFFSLIVYVLKSLRGEVDLINNGP